MATHLPSEPTEIGEPFGREGQGATPPDALRDVLLETGRHISMGGRFASDTAQGVRDVLRSLRGEQISLRAAALTYLSIFSLIPLLTIAVVLLKTFRQEQVQRRLTLFVQDVLAPGIRDDMVALLARTIDRASATTAGSIGFVMLLISAVFLIRNLDTSINAIFNVRRKRPLTARLAIYVSVLTIGPLLLGVSLAGTSGLADVLAGRFSFLLKSFTALSSLVIVVGGFSLLYLLAPNAPVRVRSALAGASVAGVGWECAKYLYADFATQIFRANPVYGSLGAAPLFLVWIYLSWLLLLFGARLAYAVENSNYQGAFTQLDDHPRAQEVVAAQIAQQLTLAQLTGSPPPTPRSLSAELEVPEVRIRELVERMQKAGLIRRQRRRGLLPARSVEEMTLADISNAVGGFSKLAAVPRKRLQGAPVDVEVVYTRLEQAGLDRLRRVSWAQLAAARLEGWPASGERPALSRNP